MLIILAMLLTVVLFSRSLSGSFMDLYNDKNGYTWITNESSPHRFFSYSYHKPEHIQFRGPHSQGNMLSIARLEEMGMVGVYLRNDIAMETPVLYR